MTRRPIRQPDIFEHSACLSTRGFESKNLTSQCRVKALSTGTALTSPASSLFLTNMVEAKWCRSQYLPSETRTQNPTQQQNDQNIQDPDLQLIFSAPERCKSCLEQTVTKV